VGKPVVLLVGHCRPDNYALRAAVHGAVPDADVRFATDTASLEANLGDADLLLVNRMLDGWFDDAGGIDMIARLKREGAGAKVMLISNYPESLAEAVAAGGVPGFGKLEQRSERARRCILAALGIDE